MQYGKLINGVFEPFTGRYIRHNGRVYSNPTEATLTQLGYKPLTEAERPEEREGYYITAVYTANDTEIIQEYKYIEMPEEPAETEALRSEQQNSTNRNEVEDTI
ncbi:MAG: hypothetical protein ACI38A_06080 [Candidatus Ornithomonoglobus sp.]